MVPADAAILAFPICTVVHLLYNTAINHTIIPYIGLSDVSLLYGYLRLLIHGRVIHFSSLDLANDIMDCLRRLQ